MEGHLQDYPFGPKQKTITAWKKKGASGYVLYNNSVKKMLVKNGCGEREEARRELDQLVWWEGRKKDKLNDYLKDAIKACGDKENGTPVNHDEIWLDLAGGEPTWETYFMDKSDFDQVLTRKLGAIRKRKGSV